MSFQYVVYIYVCMSVCLYVCMYASMHPCIHASMHPCIHASMYTCIHVIHVYMYVLCPFNMSYIFMYQNISYIFGLHTHIQTYISWESAFPAHFPGKSAFLMHSPSVRFPGLSGAMWPISGPLQWHVVKCSISSISLGHIWAGLDTTSMYRHMPPPPQTCPP